MAVKVDKYGVILDENSLDSGLMYSSLIPTILVENLVTNSSDTTNTNSIMATSAIVGISSMGTKYSDIIYGSALNDYLDGGTGNDKMYGYAGNDLLLGGYGNDTLNGGDGIDDLYGGSGDDLLYGGAGDDYLDGGTGTDKMYGGAGHDLYVVDSSSDSVIEYANQGIDGVITSLYTYNIQGNIENLYLAEGTFARYGIGNSLDNTLDGNSRDNILVGGAGNDTLSGEAGADKMYGGTGDDTFYVDNIKDAVIEYAAQGTDTVIVSSIENYTLSANVENLFLDNNALNGIGNSLNNILEGNSANNRLFGDAGNDLLLGGSGNDVLNGGNGRDRLEGGSGNDVLNGGLGQDTFVFNRLDWSSSAGVGYDQINDFTSNKDKTLAGLDDILDLKGLFVGTVSATSGHMHFATSGADTIMQIDCDGGGNSYTNLLILKNITMADNDITNLLSSGQIVL